MLTKKFTDFSADLLDTVRGVLGEAKKCKDCGCGQCECEKEEAKEGYVPTADEPSEHDKKTADKVRALLAKEKKPVKEETEIEEAFRKSQIELNLGKSKKQFLSPPDTVGGMATKRIHHDEKNDVEVYHGMRGHKSTPHYVFHKDKLVHMTTSRDNAMKHAEKLAKKLAEEAEQIDEISKAKLGRYINKAKDSIDLTAWRQGHKEGGAGNPSGHLEKKLSKRHKGIETAVKKLTKEESDYLEKDLKKRKANNDKAIKDMKKMGSPMKNPHFGEEAEDLDESAKVAAHLIKRYGDNVRKSHVRSAANDFGVGYVALSHAVRKKLGVNRLEEEQIDELSKATLGSYTKKAAGSAAGVAAAAAAQAAITGKAGEYDKRALRNRLTGISKATDRLTKEEAEQIDELSKATMGRYINKAATKMGSQGITAGLKIAADEKSSKNFKDMGKREKGIATAVKKLTKEDQDFIDSLNNDMFEEIEIAEANLKVGDYTATSEKSKFHKNGYRPHLKNAEGKTSYLASVAYKSPKHAAGEAAAYHKGYTSGPGKASERGADDAVRAYRHKNKEHMHEEVELEEARGRPKKAGGKDFTIHPKTKEKLMHNNPEHMKKIERLQKFGVLPKPKTEASQHIMNQLSKAKTSMTGGATIHFTHGDSKHVSGTHAAKLIAKYQDMKPHEKEDFQKKIGHSHEQLMKHV